MYPGYRPLQGVLSVYACNQVDHTHCLLLDIIANTLAALQGMPPPWLLETTYLLPAIIDELSVLELHMNETIWDIRFSVCLLLFSILFLIFMHTLMCSIS